MSGLVTPEIFMNIISCHIFSKSSTSTVILTCRSALFPYDLYKVFVVVEIQEGGLDNIPMSLQMQIHADNLHQKDSILTCKAAIPSIYNTLKK